MSGQVLIDTGDGWKPIGIVDHSTPDVDYMVYDPEWEGPSFGVRGLAFSGFGKFPTITLPLPLPDPRLYWLLFRRIHPRIRRMHAMYRRCKR